MARPKEYDVPTVAQNAGLYNPGKELATAATPGFVRNPAQEAAAIAAGVATKAEIEARGGVNAAGYYGDSYNPETSLTDAEYAAAVAGKTGAAQGAAVNEAINKKVELWGKKYCEKHHIDLLLIQGQGGQINYVNKKMDVTKEFINFLNENQSSIEKEL